MLGLIMQFGFCGGGPLSSLRPKRSSLHAARRLFANLHQAVTGLALQLPRPVYCADVAHRTAGTGCYVERNRHHDESYTTSGVANTADCR